MIPGRFAFTRATASACVRATPSTRWPRTLYKSFEIERDERFILNDQNIGCDLGRQFATGLLDKFAQFRCIDIQDLGSVILGQPFKSNQEKGLTWLRRNLGQMALDGLAPTIARRLAVQGDRIPDLCEEPIESDPGGKCGVQDLRVLHQRLQGRRDVSIA